MGVDYEIILSVCFYRVGDEVVVICHRVELELDLSDILLEAHCHVSDALLRSGFLF